MTTLDELGFELAAIRAELKRVQEELLHESIKKARLEGELDGFTKCFKLINSLPSPDPIPECEDMN